MTTDQIVEEIRGQIARRKKRAIETIASDAELIRGLGLDSLDYAAVVVGVEAQIGGELDEGAVNWPAVKTVRDLAQALERHVKV